jgi:hypothetical protein
MPVLANLHFQKKSGYFLQRVLAAQQEHVIFGMQKSFGGETQEIIRHPDVMRRPRIRDCDG